MKRLLAILLLCTSAFATTTVTGNIKTLGTGSVTSGTFVRFWLRGCSGNQPRVTGTGIIGPSQGGVFYFDFVANASGQISGTLYSTRDASGTGNGDIECGGSYTAVWYGMQAFVAGKGGPEIPVHAKNASTLDISNVTPITTNPVVTSPTGDSTYLRLDGGNSPVTGPVIINSVNKVVYADQFPSVQAAIAALPVGGGTVLLSCGTTYTGPPAASYSNGVTLMSACPGMYSTTLSYSSGLVIGPLSGLTLKGVTLNFTGTANLQIAVVAYSDFDMKVLCATGSPCVYITANNVSGSTFNNRFDYLDITTAGQIGLQLDAATGFVTLNDFNQTHIRMTQANPGGTIIAALDFERNCDSNHFQSTHLYFTNIGTGNGVIWNNSNPTVDIDADNEVLDFVDITSGVTITGTAYQVNKSAGNTWFEGFGQTSFTTPVAADSTTNYLRFELEGSSLHMGQTGLNSSPGSPLTNLFLPTVGNTLISDTANQVMTNKTLTSPAFGTGIFNNGSGFKHARNGTTCTTAAAAGATCATAVSWGTAFADTSYTLTCSGIGTGAGVPVAGSTSKAVGSATFTTVAGTAAAAQFSEIDCIAVHD